MSEKAATGDGFGGTQARTVTQHESGAVFEDGDVAEEVEDLVEAEHDGEFLGDLHVDELPVGPGHFEGDRLEELGGGEEAVNALWR